MAFWAVKPIRPSQGQIALCSAIRVVVKQNLNGEREVFLYRSPILRFAPFRAFAPLHCGRKCASAHQFLFAQNAASALLDGLGV